jgi:lipopolysaccharide/colanic/teichoic acid biosynthesis glycosyltransferase
VPTLILFSPVLAALSLLVRIKLGAPIFFRQPRPGRRPALTGCAQTRAERNALSRESRRRLDGLTPSAHLFAPQSAQSENQVEQRVTGKFRGITTWTIINMVRGQSSKALQFC